MDFQPAGSLLIFLLSACLSVFVSLQMSHLIHSQAGQLASQRLKSQTLQQSLHEELAVTKERVAVQEKEIHWLKKFVTLLAYVVFSFISPH